MLVKLSFDLIEVKPEVIIRSQILWFDINGIVMVPFIMKTIASLIANFSFPASQQFSQGKLKCLLIVQKQPISRLIFFDQASLPVIVLSLD